MFLPNRPQNKGLIYLKDCAWKPRYQVESHFCSQTDHLTPPKGVSAIASQAITVFLPRPWGACLVQSCLWKGERGSVPGPRGKACCQEPGLFRCGMLECGVSLGLAQSLGFFLSLLTCNCSPPQFKTLATADIPSHEGAAPLREGVVSCGLAAPPGFPWGAPDHLSLAAPRPFLEGWEKGAERTVEALPCAAVARRMRTAGQVRGALTSWHSPSPFAVTLYIRVSCPPHSKPPSPPSLGSSPLRQRGRCGGAPGPAAAARSGPGAPPSAVRSLRRLREARPSA